MIIYNLKAKAFNTILAYARLTRAFMSLLLGVCAYVGFYLTGSAAGLKDGLALFAMQAAVAAIGFVVNDILDLHRDSGVTVKPLVSGALSIKNASWLLVGLMVVVLFSLRSLQIGVWALAFTQITIVCSYSKLKLKSGLAANLVTALLCGSAFCVGPIQAHSWGLATWAALITASMITGREIAKDILDFEGDQRAGLPTLPVLRGNAWSGKLTVTFSAIAALLMAVFASKYGVFGNQITSGISIILLFIGGLLLCKSPNARGASSYLQLSNVAMILAVFDFATSRST